MSRSIRRLAYRVAAVLSIALLGTAAGEAAAQPVEPVLALAKKEKQPLLDTMKELVSIETGSRDLEGLERAANLIAARLRSLGGEVELVDPSANAYRMEDTPARIGKVVHARFEGKGTKKILLLALVPALALWLPSTPSRTQLGYGRLLRSLAGYLRGNAALRRASTIQFLLGISYGGFWATVAPMLAMFHGFGPAKTGLMGIPGAAGILIAQPAGRWLDRRGAHPIVTAGSALVLAAFVVFGFAELWIGAAIAGAVLLDCGIRASLVANQTLVTSVAPEARSRFNTIFGAHVWGGNAAGAFLASTALAHSGWTAVCAIAVSASCLALILQWRSRGARPSP